MSEHVGLCCPCSTGKATVLMQQKLHITVKSSCRHETVDALVGRKLCTYSGAHEAVRIGDIHSTCRHRHGTTVVQVCAGHPEHMAHAGLPQSLPEAAQGCCHHPGPSEGQASPGCICRAAAPPRCRPHPADSLQGAPSAPGVPAAEGCSHCCADGLQAQTGRLALDPSLCGNSRGTVSRALWPGVRVPPPLIIV